MGLGSEKAGRPAAGKPQLELLETRDVPAAIRPLPGLMTFALPRGTANNHVSAQTNIGFKINFFGTQTSTLFVNTSGNVTLTAPFNFFTNPNFPANLGTAIIAPFYADIDIRNANNGFANTITYGQSVLCGRKVFGVDWLQVDFFNSTAPAHVPKSNSFQLLLIDRSDTGVGNFDIEFNYDQITWDTADGVSGGNGTGTAAAAGISASAGFSGGTGAPASTRTLPGSGVPNTFLDTSVTGLIRNLLLSTTPGRYHFQIRNGTLFTPTAGEATGLVNVYNPLRFLYDPASMTYRGNMTMTNGLLFQTAATDFCLDEPPQAGRVPVFTPVTLVFTNLPTGVTLLNATGVTASGAPYITTAGSAPFSANTNLRFPIVLANPGRAYLGTFFRPLATRVFLGPFDPTLA
jgi:hypothetical protein